MKLSHFLLLALTLGACSESAPEMSQQPPPEPPDLRTAVESDCNLALEYIDKIARRQHLDAVGLILSSTSQGAREDAVLRLSAKLQGLGTLESIQLQHLEQWVPEAIICHLELHIAGKASPLKQSVSLKQEKEVWRVSVGSTGLPSLRGVSIGGAPSLGVINEPETESNP